MSSSGSSSSAAAPVAPITLQHVFGLKGDVKDNVHYIDEMTVLYPAGYNIVLHNTENNKPQKFVPLGTNHRFVERETGKAFVCVLIRHAPLLFQRHVAHVRIGNICWKTLTVFFVSNVTNDKYAGSQDYVTACDISAICVSNRTTTSKGGRYLAVAERGDQSRAVVSVFDLFSQRKKNKSIIQDASSREYVCMCFSPDGKYLLTQGGAPDWSLVNWQWEKGRPVQSARVSNPVGSPIYQCSFCPKHPSVVCVTGNGILRFLHIENLDFKWIPVSLGKREPQNYLCHCWLDEQIVVGTDTGDILLFDNAEFQGVLESSPSDGKSIDCITAFSKGFICGCDEGVIYIFERDEKEFFKRTKSFQIDNNYVRVRNIAISPSEDNITCTLENNQVGRCSGGRGASHVSSFASYFHLLRFVVVPCARCSKRS